MFKMFVDKTKVCVSLLTFILCLSITAVSHGSELASIQIIENIPDKSVSADGRYTVFQSTVSSLVSGDTNNFSDIYMYDSSTKQIELISKGLSEPESNNDSLNPSISADGNYVIFQSKANNLVSNDINNSSDIFLYNRQSKQIELISVSHMGLQGNNNSYDPIIGIDGRYGSFSSDANNLVLDDTNNKVDLFTFDHTTKKIELINGTNIGMDELSQPGPEKSLTQLTGIWPNLSSTAYSSLNPFYKSGYGGQCTAFSWGRTREKLDIALSTKFYGDAKTWWNGAIGIYNRGTTPKGNSIAVWGSGTYGHVAFVEQVSGNTVTFNEANWKKYVNTKYGGGYDGAPVNLSSAQMANRGGYILLGYIYVGGEGEVPQPSNNIIYPGQAGFTTGGKYWWNASGYGINGTMKYTYCNGNTRDSWGKWSFNLAAVGGDGKYKVEAYIPNNHATTSNAHYHILHASQIDYKSVNQNNIYNAWVDLGTYDFTTASTAAVELDDATGETYANSGSPKIGFDAMRLTYVGPIYTPVTGVSLNKNVSMINVGTNEILTVTILPTNATNKAVTWDSSNPAVATVDSNGNVKGVKAGKSDITVTTVDGNKTAICKVEVTNPEVLPTHQNISLDKEWRISFSQPVGSNQSVLESNILLWRIDPVTKAKVQVDITPVIDSANSQVVIVRHSTPFIAGASYELLVNVGIKNVSGKPLAKTSSLVFMTKAL